MEIENNLIALINRFVNEKKMYPHQHADLIDALVKCGWGVNFPLEEELEENINPSYAQQIQDLRRAQEALSKKLEATQREYLKHLQKRNDD